MAKPPEAPDHPIWDTDMVVHGLPITYEGTPGWYMHGARPHAAPNDPEAVRQVIMVETTLPTGWLQILDTAYLKHLDGDTRDDHIGRYTLRMCRPQTSLLRS